MMATIQDLRDKSPGELSAHLLELRKEQFSLSMQKMTGQQTKPHETRRIRREIARVKFLLGTQQGTP